MPARNIFGVPIPDSSIAHQATQLVRDTVSDFLFRHSMRVYLFASMAANRKGLAFDPELLYVAAMFHDVGLTEGFHESQLRFEVDSANAARNFLRSHGIDETDVQKVWTAIAFHTTPGIPEFLHAESNLLQLGAAMDVAGRGYEEFTEQERDLVAATYPRERDFNQRMIDAFYDGMKHRPMSTFGTFNEDFIAYKNPTFKHVDICSIMLNSAWAT